MEVGRVGCGRARVVYAIVLRAQCYGGGKDAVDDVRGTLEG